MNNRTDTENEWLASGMIIYQGIARTVTICVTDLVLNSFAWATDLAVQQDELAGVASTPELKAMFEENARDLRRWVEVGDAEYSKSGRPLSSISPALAARANCGYPMVGPSNFHDYMQNLMKRVVPAQRGVTLTFVFVEAQVPPYGPSLYATKDHEFLIKAATSGVIASVVATDELYLYFKMAMQKFKVAEDIEVPEEVFFARDEAPDSAKGSIMDEPPSRPSASRRRTPKKRT